MEQKESEQASTGVAVGVIFNEARSAVLCGQRAEGRLHQFKWEFPGGKINKNEDVISAAVREVAEEVGLSVDPIKALDEVDFNYGGDIGRVRVSFVECVVRGNFEPIVNPAVHKEIRWVDIKSLSLLDWIEADMEFVRKLSKGG